VNAKRKRECRAAQMILHLIFAGGRAASVMCDRAATPHVPTWHAIAAGLRNGALIQAALRRARVASVMQRNSSCAIN